MDNGEPPGARSEEIPITPDHPLSDAANTNPTKAARVGIVATLPHTPTMRDYLDRVVHDVLRVPEGPDGTHISLATHVTSVLYTRGDTAARLLITLTPRPEHRERAIRMVNEVVQKYAHTMQGVMHDMVEDEENLRRVATGK